MLILTDGILHVIIFSKGLNMQNSKAIKIPFELFNKEKAEVLDYYKNLFNSSTFSLVKKRFDTQLKHIQVGKLETTHGLQTPCATNPKHKTITLADNLFDLENNTFTSYGEKFINFYMNHEFHHVVSIRKEKTNDRNYKRTPVSKYIIGFNNSGSNSFVDEAINNNFAINSCSGEVNKGVYVLETIVGAFFMAILGERNLALAHIIDKNYLKDECARLSYNPSFLAEMNTMLFGVLKVQQTVFENYSKKGKEYFFSDEFKSLITTRQDLLDGIYGDLVTNLLLPKLEESNKNDKIKIINDLLRFVPKAETENIMCMLLEEYGNAKVEDIIQDRENLILLKENLVERAKENNSISLLKEYVASFDKDKKLDYFIRDYLFKEKVFAMMKVNAINCEKLKEYPEFLINKEKTDKLFGGVNIKNHLKQSANFFNYIAYREGYYLYSPFDEKNIKNMPSMRKCKFPKNVSDDTLNLISEVCFDYFKNNIDNNEIENKNLSKEARCKKVIDYCEMIKAEKEKISLSQIDRFENTEDVSEISDEMTI